MKQPLYSLTLRCHFSVSKLYASKTKHWME